MNVLNKKQAARLKLTLINIIYIQTNRLSPDWQSYVWVQDSEIINSEK